MNSVDLDKLDTAITSSRLQIGSDSTGLQGELRVFAALYDGVLSRCQVQVADQVSIEKTDALLTQWADTDTEGEIIYDLLIDDHSGVATFDGGPVVEQLEARSGGRSDISAEPGEFLGMPPTSGYADDPVCTANGNFVHQETDIGFIGFAELINAQRTYNAMAADVAGAFGLGWTSRLDMTVTRYGTDLVRVRMADGAEIPFRLEPESGLFTRNDRRGLTLESSSADQAAGFVLTSNEDESWTFDADGRLVGGSKGHATFTVERSDERITITEQLSGRSARYALDDRGRVSAITSSDGRVASFTFDDAGFCVRVDRSTGAMDYEIGDGRIVSMVDADGVMWFRNEYDAEGRVTSQTNEYGRVSNYEYIGNGMTRLTYGEDGPSNLHAHDEQGNLTALYGSDGGAMRMWWDDHNRLVRLVERGGAETRYEFDPTSPQDLLLRRIDPDGLEETYDYDDAGRLVARTGRDGVTKHYAYDGDRVVPARIVEADGTETSARYNDQELLLHALDADGVETELLWDADGQLVGVISSTGARSTIVYDRAGNLARVTDPMGHEQTFSYDDGGRLLSTTVPSGVTSNYTYSAAGRALSCSSEGPGSWSVTYNSAGLAETFTDAGGATTRFAYDDFGQLIAQADPTGATYRREVDALGRQLAMIDPFGATTVSEYTRNGRTRAVIHPDGSRSEATVDAFGRTTSITTPGGHTSSWSYHPNGELSSHTDGAGHTTIYELDELGRLVAELGSDRNATRYTYTPAGRLASVVSPGGRRHEFTNDAEGRIASVTNADGETMVASYRLDGHVSTVTNDDGRTTTIDYDRAARVTGISISGLGQGPMLNIGPYSLEVSRPAMNSSRFSFDARGLLGSVVAAEGLVTDFSFDPRRQLAEVSVGDARSTYTYDAVGNLQTATDPLGVVNTYGYSATGHLETVSIGDRLGLAYTNDGDGRVVAVDGADGQNLARYGYDQRGLIEAASNEHGSVRLGRDAAGRVVSSTGLGGSTMVYARDEDGLVMQRTDGDGVSVGYIRTAAGRLSGFSDPVAGQVPVPDDPDGRSRDPEGRVLADEVGRTYRYDNAGRLVEAIGLDGERRAFTYNDYGLLATDETPEFARRVFTYNQVGAIEQIGGADGSTTQLGYDEAGRRTTERHADGSAVDYVWNDLNQLIRVVRTALDGTTATTEIIYSALGRVEQVAGIAIGWDDGCCPDPISIGGDRYLRSGSSVLRCEPGAEWSNGLTDDPFGLISEPEHVMLGYRGELTIDGLIFLGARIYDPRTRCFLSRDPLPSVPGQIGFGGLYTYAHNDPINFVDPTGCRPLSDEEFQAVRTELERTALQSAGNFGWEHRDTIKGIAVGVVAIAGAAAFCGATAGVGCVVLAGAAIGAGTMVALDAGDAYISGEGYGWSDAGWSLLEGAVIGGASAGAGMINAAANPLVLKPTTGMLTNSLAFLGGTVPRSALAQGMARTAVVDFGLTQAGNTLLDLVRFGEPRWSDGNWVDWIS